MNPPTPAAVRYSLKTYDLNECTKEEIDAFNTETRNSDEILRDHIRAVAGEMRKESEEWYVASMKHGGNKAMADHANDLEKFADKLEGKEQ